MVWISGFSKLKLTKPGTSGVQQIRIQSASVKPAGVAQTIGGAQVQQVKKIDFINKECEILFCQINLVLSFMTNWC